MMLFSIFHADRKTWHCSQYLLVIITLLLVLPMKSEAAASTCQQQLSASGLPASGCNRAFSLHVIDMSFESHLDGETAPPGRQWLVMDIRFDNWISADLVFKLDYQESLLVGSLARQLYLLVDDRLVVRPRIPQGAPSDDSFVLGQVGEQQDVRVAFAIPEEPCSSLSLSYHHDQYADIVIPLIGELADAEQQRQDAQQQAGNDVMSLGVHDVSFHEQWLGEAAPEGMQWLVVDLRGQSEWQTEIDALAVTPSAAREDKAPLLRVMDYVGADQMLQAVVDGQYSYLRKQRLSTLPLMPALLSNAWAGGEAVFPIPSDVEQVELVAYFGQFLAPGIAPINRTPIRFPLGGDASSRGDDASLVEIADTPTPVTIHDLEIVSRFAGHQADDNEVLLLVDASMANTSDENGMMSVSGRFQLRVAGQQTAELVNVYLPGPQMLGEPFLLPAGELRRFQLLYRIKGHAEDLELHYFGVSMNDVTTLPLAE